MIKVVVQFIPVYLMSVFKLSVSLCKDIEAMVQKFWWVMVMQRRFIGLNGALFVLQNQLVVWGFGISRSSIMHC